MYTLVDNATLTAVQRLSGEIPIKNKYIIDSDIMAFEAFAQAVLFSEKVFYIDDYKSRYRQDRRSFFRNWNQPNWIRRPTAFWRIRQKNYIWKWCRG